MILQAIITKYLGATNSRASRVKATKTQLVPNGNGPAFVWFGENEDCFGVIMPMRQMDMRSRVRPEWVDAKPETAAPHLKVVSG